MCNIIWAQPHIAGVACHDYSSNFRSSEATHTVTLALSKNDQGAGERSFF